MALCWLWGLQNWLGWLITQGTGCQPLLSPHLTDAQTSQPLLQTLSDYPEVFSVHKREFWARVPVDCPINMGSAASIALRAYRVSQAERELVDREDEKLLEFGLVHFHGQHQW